MFFQQYPSLESEYSKKSFCSDANHFPLVLLHGWGTHSGVWNRVRDCLSSYDLHAPDLPGYGNNSSVSPYTLDTLTAYLIENLPPYFDLCGWSLGGLLAIKIAKAFPHRVRKLVLVNASPCFVSKNDWPHGIEKSTLLRFMNDLSDDCMAMLRRFIYLQVKGSEFENKESEYLREILNSRRKPEHASLMSGLNILIETDLRDLLVEVANPTLVIHGCKDILVPVAAGIWISKQLPQSYLLRIEPAAHVPFVSHPVEFCLNLRRFLND